MIDRDPWDPPPEPDPQYVDPAWVESLHSITSREPESPAAPMYPMQPEEYDAIRDDLHAAYLHDPWMLPALINRCVAALGVIAQTGVEGDNQFATQTLRHLLKDAMEATS
jgi:hypothetical protein